jgi:hypothetical protein
MTSTERQLKRALGKATHFNGKTWCGCFTPTEILLLVEAGVSPTDNGWMVNYARAQKAAGISCLLWFYFHPNKVEMMNERKSVTQKPIKR